VNDSPEPTPGPPEGAPPSPEETDSGPIDVNELLASTRQLFEPEEIDRAMEAAGYEPPRVVEGTDQKTNQVTDENTPAPDDTPAESEAVSQGDAENREELPDSDTIASDDSEEDIDSDVEKTSRKHRGLNILAVVSLVLAIALSPLAIIFGYIALGQSRRAGQRGEQLALWAIGLGWLVLAGWAIVLGSLVWIGVERGITLESLSEFIEFFSVP